jgi:hypothetical protein
MSINLSSEDLKKEHERQRKRGKLIFKTIRKGVVSFPNYEDPNTKFNFRYEMVDASVRSITNIVTGDVLCIIDCLYDNIDIFNEDGSELTQKLPLFLVHEIEGQIKHKFDMFNIELNFMSESNMLTGKSGKRNLIGEDMDEDQKMINKTRVIYKAFKRGNVGVGLGKTRYEIDWTLPNKFHVKIKHRTPEEAARVGVDSYPILLLNTETIDYIKTNGTPIKNGEKHIISGRITDQFKKHGITVYWGGEVPKYSIFSPIAKNPDDTYTDVDITPKSK